LLLVPAVVTSSSSSSSTTGPLRTVLNNNIGFATLSSPIKSSQKNKRSNFPSINTNNSNNNIYINELSSSFPVYHEPRRLSRTPTPNTSHNHRSKPKSALPSSISGNSAFHIVHDPHRTNIPHQQEQYITLLHMLKAQEIQFEQQQKELDEKQKGTKNI
jgi:hypothetical protein